MTIPESFMALVGNVKDSGFPRPRSAVACGYGAHWRSEAHSEKLIHRTEPDKGSATISDWPVRKATIVSICAAKRLGPSVRSSSLCEGLSRSSRQCQSWSFRVIRVIEPSFGECMFDPCHDPPSGAAGSIPNICSPKQMSTPPFVWIPSLPVGLDTNGSPTPRGHWPASNTRKRQQSPVGAGQRAVGVCCRPDLTQCELPAGGRGTDRSALTSGNAKRAERPGDHSQPRTATGQRKIPRRSSPGAMGSGSQLGP